MKVRLAAMITVVLWASSFVGIRYALSDYHPGSMALLRFLVASLAMAGAYFSLAQRKMPSLREALSLLLLGVMGIGIYNISLNYGELHVTAGIASFIIGLIPVCATVLAGIVLKERASARQWSGVGISVLGMALIVFGEADHHAQLQSVLLLFVACSMGATYSVCQKFFLRSFHPIEVTSFIIWGGTLLLLIYQPQLQVDIIQASWKTTLTVVYMGIFPAAIAYVTWSYTVEHMPIAKATLYLYSLPLVATLMGFVFLAEMPDLLSLTGGTIAMLGAIYANRMDKS